MNLKSILRSYIPPIIWEGIRLFKRKYRTYSSWTAAAAAAGSYEAETINRFRVERSGAIPSLCDNALVWLVRIFPNDISVVDFGGSVGEVGRALKAAGIDLRYTVVENVTLVSMMAAVGGEGFTGVIPEQCDVFYTSGTLQCISEPYLVLEQGFRSARRAVVLKRNNFCERDIFTVHTNPLFDNGSGPIPKGFANITIAYPFRTIKESEVMAIAARNGFNLFARTPEIDGIVVPREGVYGAQLVFLKD